MKINTTVVLLVTFGISAYAQPKPKPIAEQRFFNLEDAVKNQVSLSDAELASLTADETMHKILDQDPPTAKPTQEGLEAAVVHLCNPAERDLIVVGNGDPYVGANVGPFWIIRDLPSGPIVVLSETSLSLTIEGKHSNSCLNVQAFAATAAEGTTTDFSFNGEKYIISRQKSARLKR